MIKLISKARFLDGGTMIEEGEAFSVRNEDTAREYVLRGLAHYESELHEPHTPAEAKSIEETGAIDYGRMTVAELREAAKEKGIEGYSKMNKGDLVTALERA